MNDQPQAADAFRYRLAWQNGLILGLGLALGLWGRALYLWATLPVHWQHLWLNLLGLGFVLAACGLTSRLTARWSRAGLVFVAWLAAALLMNEFIGRLPYSGRTLLNWLIHPVLYGLPLYPAEELFSVLLVAGFFLTLCLSILGLLQNYRLDNLGLERGEDGRLSFRGRILLWLPLPITLAFGLLVGSVHAGTLWVGVRTVAQIIDEGRTYSGDLFWYGQQRGLNYVAIEKLRDRMVGDYSLSIETLYAGYGGVDVDARFENGLWARCRVNPRGDNGRYDYVAFCRDAGLAYRVGLPTVWSGEAPGCRECALEITPTWRDWLLARFPQLPTVTLAAAAGNYTAVRLDSAESPPATALCILTGPPPVSLIECRDVD